MGEGCQLRFRNIFDNPRRRIWLVVFPALAALGLTFSAVTANAFGAAEQREQAEKWYVHALQVLLVTGELNTSVHGALRGERGYLLTNNPDFLRPYLRSRSEAPYLLTQLRELTRDNAEQQANVGRLETSLFEYLEGLKHTVSLAEAGETSKAMKLVKSGTGRQRIEALLAIIHDIEAEERVLLELRRSANEEAKREIEQSGKALVLVAALLLVLLAYASIAALNASARAARATSELRRLATTDELTGLANRRSFLEALERERERARRNGNPLCLAILDVDHFKKINDRHGHPVGDEVLQRVAWVLQQATRAGDVVGRIGGEEFGVLMPETARDQAFSVCERLCASMESTPVALPSRFVGVVTLSTGVAVLAEEESPDHLISRADAALYAAKFGGRNQVKLAA